MSPSQTVDDVSTKLKGAVVHFQDELKKLRTGRAHPSMLDGVMVVAYGTPMPLNQVSNIVAAESQLLQITPFDPNNLQKIADAIRSNQSLGMNPMDDGRVVRVPVPALTTERRQQIVKQMNEKVEETHIACRSIRHEALDSAKRAKSDKDISEDDYARIEKQVDELMAKAKSEVESLAKAKEQEIMTV